MTDTALAAAPTALPTSRDRGLPANIGLAIFYDDRLYQRCKEIAEMIAGAQGYTPKHLVGKKHACFMVVVNALNWKLAPMAVAMSTYETPGGRIGYEGKLVQAALENSGRFVDQPIIEYFGEWERVEGKFVMAESQRTDSEGQKKKYARANYGPADEVGLGIRITWQLRGEASPRKFELRLRQCHPRNSTLWATDPKTQIQYTAMRRFGNVTVPHILMGLPFDHEEAAEFMPGDDAKPLNEAPEPTRADFGAKAVVDIDTGPEDEVAQREEVHPEFEIVHPDGEVVTVIGVHNAVQTAIASVTLAAKDHGRDGIEGWAESNARLIAQLEPFETAPDAVRDVMKGLLERYRPRSEEAKTDQTPKTTAPAGTAPKERPNKAFWIRATYQISPAGRGGRVNWKWWGGEIGAAIGEALTKGELMKLQTDNEQNLNDLKEAEPAIFQGLMDDFVRRAGELDL